MLSEETRDRLLDKTILAVTENPGLVDPENIEQSLAWVIDYSPDSSGWTAIRIPILVHPTEVEI